MVRRTILAIVAVTLVYSNTYARRRHRQKKEKSPSLEVLIKGEQSGDPVVRAIAVSALWRFKKDGYKYIHDALFDPQWIVKREAIKALFRMKKYDEAFKALNKALEDPTLPWGTDFAIIMAALPKTKALKFIKKTLNNPKFTAKDEVMKSLLMYGGDFARFVAKLAIKGNKSAIKAIEEAPRDVVLPILSMLYRTTNPDTIRLVLDMADRFGIKLPIKALRTFARTKDLKLKGRIALMLAKAKDRTALRFVRGFINKKGDELKVFLKVFALVPDKRLAKKIKQLYLKDTTPEDILELTLRALAAVDDADAAKFASKGVNSTDENVRVASVATIHLFQKGAALPLLHKLVFDGNPKVRIAAVNALGDLGRKESIVILQRVLNQAFDPNYKLHVINALSKFKDDSVIDVLRFYIYDNNIKIKRAAIRVIAGFHSPKAAQTLRPFLDNPDREIRSLALKNIIQTDPQIALSRIDSTASGLSEDEIIALALQFKAKFKPFLEKILKSTIPFVRLSGLKCLFAIDKKDRIDIIKELVTNSKYPDMRLGALKEAALESCKLACPLSQKLVNDKDINCQLAAVRVMGSCCAKGVKEELITLMSKEVGPVSVQAAATYLTVPKRPKKKLSPLEFNEWILR